RKVNDVARTAIGPDLGEVGNVGIGGETAEPPGLVLFGGPGTGVAEPAIAKYLAPDEDHVAINQPVRLDGVEPGAVLAAQVAHAENAVEQEELGVHRREVSVVREVDVGSLSSDGGDRVEQRVPLGGSAAPVEQQQLGSLANFDGRELEGRRWFSRRSRYRGSASGTEREALVVGPAAVGAGAAR